jgi:prepilin-type N-terminal cleavage/methylation domain-containing protein
MRRRQAFTLVELLVVSALIVFIMAIISQAFVTATGTFRDLKALADLSQKLRGVRTIMTKDLTTDHFEGKKRLSNLSFWDSGPPENGFFRVYSKVHIETPPAPAQPYPSTSYFEGVDSDGIPSFRAFEHVLHFTIKLRGNQRSDFLSANVPANSPLLAAPALGLPDRRYQDSANTYNAQWAEVAYFLRATPDTANGTQLYSLYRRQLLAVPSDALNLAKNPFDGKDYRVTVADAIPTDANGNKNYSYLEMSAQPNPADNTTLYFNSPLDLTMPARRFGMDPQQQAGLLPQQQAGLFLPTVGAYPVMAEQNRNFQAADLLLTDVISFDVRVLLDGGTDFVELTDNAVQAFSNNNRQFYPNFVKGTNPPQYFPVVFDTWSKATDNIYDYSSWAMPGNQDGTSIPLYQSATTGKPIVIKAVQITIRAWDFKTQQSRQTTLVQEM